MMIQRPHITFAAAFCALVLVGCATPPPSTDVILLPQDNGAPSAVRVSATARPGASDAPRTRLLTCPYQRAHVSENKPVSVGNTTAEAVQKAYPEVFALRPDKPERFTLYFEAGASEPTPQTAQLLGDALRLAQSRPGSEIVIIGHTDTTGDARENDALSLKRAQQVRDLLKKSSLFQQQPLPDHRIETVGRGQRELAVKTPPQVAESQNRRVELVVR